MREIKFRGKRPDTMEWAVGSLVECFNGKTGIVSMTKYSEEKAIKERAKKYARKVWRGGTREYGSHMKLTECDFIAGAQSEREELTRWRNPNEELPENNSCVLMKVSDGEHERIYLGARQDDVWMCDGGYSFCQNAEECLGYDGVVIGWRPIYENE